MIAITRLICVDQSQGLKSAKDREGEREGEIIEMKKAPLLRRAALKTLKSPPRVQILFFPQNFYYFYLGAHAKSWNPTTTRSVVLNSGGKKEED